MSFFSEDSGCSGAAPSQVMILLFVLLVFLLLLFWDDVARGRCLFKCERFDRLSAILCGSISVSSNNKVDEAEREHGDDTVEDHGHIDSRLLHVVIDLIA